MISLATLLAPSGSLRGMPGTHLQFLHKLPVEGAGQNSPWRLDRSKKQGRVCHAHADRFAAFDTQAHVRGIRADSHVAQESSRNAIIADWESGGIGGLGLLIGGSWVRFLALSTAPSERVKISKGSAFHP